MNVKFNWKLKQTRKPGFSPFGGWSVSNASLCLGSSSLSPSWKHGTFTANPPPDGHGAPMFPHLHGTAEASQHISLLPADICGLWFGKCFRVKTASTVGLTLFTSLWLLTPQILAAFMTLNNSLSLSLPLSLFTPSHSSSLHPCSSMWKCIIECLQRKEIRPSIVQNSCRGKNVGIHQPSSKIASLSPFKTFRTRVSRQDLSTQPWCSKIIFHFCCYKRVLIITSVPLDCLDGKAIAPFTKINLFQYIFCIGSGLDLLLVLFI